MPTTQLYPGIATVLHCFNYSHETYTYSSHRRGLYYFTVCVLKGYEVILSVASWLFPAFSPLTAIQNLQQKTPPDATSYGVITHLRVMKYLRSYVKTAYSDRKTASYFIATHQNEFKIRGCKIEVCTYSGTMYFKILCNFSFINLKLGSVSTCTVIGTIFYVDLSFTSFIFVFALHLRLYALHCYV